MAQHNRIHFVAAELAVSALPDGNGYALLNELRRRCSAVGIAMTGYKALDDLDPSRRGGWQLISGIDFDALKTVIAHLLSR